MIKSEWRIEARTITVAPDFSSGGICASKNFPDLGSSGLSSLHFLKMIKILRSIFIQKVITFISPINKIFHALFIKNPSETYNYAAYTEPMHWLAWVGLLVFIAVVPPILFITAR